MKKVIEIEGKKIDFASNGKTLRFYRMYFKKDFLQDFLKLQKIIEKNNGNVDDDILSNFDMTTIENLAYICAKTANADLPDIDEWLEQFESPFSLLNKANEIIECVSFSMQSIKAPKKKRAKKVA